MKRDKFACKKCGDTETTLHVHHKEYHDGAKVWEYDNKYLITLCKDCHTTIETLKKERGCTEYDEIKIYKSKWSSGNKIVFGSCKETLSMEIYNKENVFVMGFNLWNKIPELKKLYANTKKLQKVAIKLK